MSKEKSTSLNKGWIHQVQYISSLVFIYVLNKFEDNFHLQGVKTIQKNLFNIFKWKNATTHACAYVCLYNIFVIHNFSKSLKHNESNLVLLKDKVRIHPRMKFIEKFCAIAPDS